MDFPARRMGFSCNFLLMWSKGKFHSERRNRAPSAVGKSFPELGMKINTVDEARNLTGDEKRLLQQKSSFQFCWE